MAAADYIDEQNEELYYNNLNNTFFNNSIVIHIEIERLTWDIDNIVGRLTPLARKNHWQEVDALVKRTDQTKKMGRELWQYYSKQKRGDVRLAQARTRAIESRISLLTSEIMDLKLLFTDQYLYRTPGTPLRKKRQEENDSHGVVELAHKWRRDQEELMKANKVGSMNPYIICK